MEGSSSKKFKSICAFCGAFLGKGSEYMRAVNNLGAMLIAQGINLIYGGADMGLLGCLASSAKLGGCTALAIISKAFAIRKINSVTLGTKLHVVSLHEKMGNMLSNAYALIVLPDGLGTLKEIFNTTSLAQLCLHQKHLGILNVNDFYYSLLSFLNHTVDKSS